MAPPLFQSILVAVRYLVVQCASKIQLNSCPIISCVPFASCAANREIQYCNTQRMINTICDALRAARIQWSTHEICEANLADFIFSPPSTVHISMSFFPCKRPRQDWPRLQTRCGPSGLSRGQREHIVSVTFPPQTEMSLAASLFALRSCAPGEHRMCVHLTVTFAGGWSHFFSSINRQQPL